MTHAILQVRDVPDGVLHTLKQRAERMGISLSAYVRDLLAEDAAAEPTADVIARIATRPEIVLDDEDIIAAIHEGRQ